MKWGLETGESIPSFPAHEQRVGNEGTASSPQPSPPLGEEREKSASPGSLLGMKIRYFGDYEILEEIAHGGMGVVYKACQISLNRLVALKMIRLGQFASPSAVERFHNETEAAARLDHPNIVPIYEVGERDGLHYFSMKLVEGQNLEQAVSGKAFPVKRAAELLAKVAEAVHYAHQRGILHRDLKPANILLDQNGEPYVTDFGLAKLVEKDTSLTQSLAVIGTPAYMSPEQAAGGAKQLTVASDVYSLGAILYHLLTGRPPFEAATEVEILRKVLDEEPVEPNRLNPEVDRDLRTICLKCLQKKPENRYGSADALEGDLCKWLSSEVISARPVGAGEKFWRWCKRKPALATISTSAVLLLIALAVGAPTALIRIDQERKNAEHSAKAEAKERGRAEETVTRLELEAAENLFRTDTPSSGIARLVRLLRKDPLNRIAAAHLLSALTHRNFALPLGEEMRHADDVLDGLFSPDGKHLITASGSTVRLWEGDSGKAITEPLRQNGIVKMMKFSPDGRAFIITAKGRNVMIRRSPDGSGSYEFPGTSSVMALTFTKDSRNVVMVSSDCALSTWDIQTHQLIKTVRIGSEPISYAIFSPDGERLVTYSESRGAAVWNLGESKSTVIAFEIDKPLEEAQFSSDGHLLVARGWRTFQTWDLNANQPFTKVLAHSKDIGARSILFSPDEQQLATTSFRTVKLWDLPSGQLFPVRIEHKDWFHQAEFNPNGDQIVATSRDGLVRLYSPATGLALCEPITTSEPVSRAHFSPDGQRLLTISGHSARLWDAHPSPRAGTVLQSRNAVRHAEFSHDGKLVLCVADDETVTIWDSSTGQRIALYPHWSETACFSPDSKSVLLTSGGSGLIYEIASNGAPKELQTQIQLFAAEFSPDGTRILGGCTDGTMRFWDTANGREESVFFGDEAPVRAATLSPDGKWLATGSKGGSARIWNSRTGEARTIPLIHPTDPGLVKFSSDGRWLATVAGREARLWDASTGRLVVGPLKHLGQINSLEFSTNHAYLVTSSDDRTLRVWDTRTGDLIAQPLKHDGAVYYAEFSPDGRRVVSASADATARVWDVKSGQPISEPLFHHEPVKEAHFSKDGHHVLTASGNGSACIWDTPDLPLPVPSWVLTLADAVAAQRFEGEVRLEPVESEAVLQCKAGLEMRNHEDLYTRWARWFFSDRLLRKLSWDSPLTVPEYVQHKMDVNDYGAALLYAPTNYLALLKLGQRKLTKAREPYERNSANFFLRRAALLCPLCPVPEAAPFQPVHNASNTATQSFSAFNLQAGSLLNDPVSRAFLQSELPPRTPSIKPQLIDLGQAFNATLSSDWYAVKNSNLSAVPLGFQQFGGTTFELRGVIKLSCKTLVDREINRPERWYPRAANGIAVNLKCERLHLLHGTGFREKEGAQIAKMILHYDDQTMAEISIVYGKDVRDWRFVPGQDEEASGDGTVVWTGLSPAAKKAGKSLRLYKSTWANPKPTVQVKTIDFISMVSNSAPFILALTVE
jgi:WD40 repeat protein/predicted Ser/Thr protein kinase